MLEQKGGMKNHSALPDLWFQTCALVPTHSPCRRRASPASCALWGDVTRRRWSGRRRSSEAGRAGKGNMALHTLSLHCDPWPPPPTPTPSKGPMSTDVEDSMTSTKGYFFIPGLSRLLRHQQSTYSPTDHSTFFVFNSFVCFFHGFPDGQNWHRQIRWFPFFFFLFSFLPRHCDCISEKLHPIPYLCNTTPAQLPQGGRCATPTYAAVNKGRLRVAIKDFHHPVQVVLYELFMSPVQDHSEYSFRNKTPHNTRVSTSSYHWVL